MAPRGRPRKRNTRLDAAVDAMKQYGFSEKMIRAQVKELLTQYGGDDGWIFIEEYAYKVLLEVCLEANTKEENADEGTSLQVIQTTADTMPLQIEMPLQIMEQTCDEEIDKVVSNSEANSSDASLADEIPDFSSPPMISSRPLLNIRPKGRPCYGWIDSDEDEEDRNDSIFVTPAP